MQVRPLRDNVLGKMLDIPGSERTTKGGVILTDSQTEQSFVRPRWFLVTHTGPKQKEIAVGQYVLVAHGRWSRGIDMVGSMRDQDKLFLIDHNEILGISEDNPLE